MPISEISSKTETRLEIHRREFRDNEYRGNLLRIEDLSPDELNIVNSDFLARCQGGGGEITQIYAAYIETLHSWGIMCPHPHVHRRYMGWQLSDVPIPFDECSWYSCALCSAAVINR